jgi:hypothetical protein
MLITIKTSQADWFAFNQHALNQLSKNYRTWLDNPWVMMPCWTLLAVLLLFIFNLGNHFHLGTAIAVAVFLIAFICTLVINSKLKQKAFAPSLKGTFIGEHQFVIDETGIGSTGNGYQAHHAWHVVQKIERIVHAERKLILVYIDTCYAFIFPEDQLNHPDDFYQLINQYTQKVNTP